MPEFKNFKVAMNEVWGETYVIRIVFNRQGQLRLITQIKFNDDKKPTYLQQGLEDDYVYEYLVRAKGFTMVNVYQVTAGKLRKLDDSYLVLIALQMTRESQVVSYLMEISRLIEDCDPKKILATLESIIASHELNYVHNQALSKLRYLIGSEGRAVPCETAYIFNRHVITRLAHCLYHPAANDKVVIHDEILNPTLLDTSESIQVCAVTKSGESIPVTDLSNLPPQTVRLVQVTVLQARYYKLDIYRVM